MITDKDVIMAVEHNPHLSPLFESLESEFIQGLFIFSTPIIKKGMFLEFSFFLPQHSKY